MKTRGRVLVVSHPAWRRTGYGAISAGVGAALEGVGVEPVVVGIEEARPALVEYRGLRHYLVPGYGERDVPTIAQRENVAGIVSVFDPFALSAGYARGGQRWVAWFAVDQNPPIPGTLEHLDDARAVWSFSDFGARALQDSGLGGARCVPLGVDSETFRPLTESARGAIREKLGIGARGTLSGVFGANYFGDRKALAENVAGWILHARENPDAFLLLWTPSGGGVDLNAVISRMADGDIARRIIGGDDFELTFGVMDSAQLAKLYSVCDLILHASAAEGFGLQILEAAACGTPSIVADNTSQSELAAGGWIIDARDLRETCNRYGGVWYRPTAAAVHRAIAEAADCLSNASECEDRRTAAREFARGRTWSTAADAIAREVIGNE